MVISPKGSDDKEGNNINLNDCPAGVEAEADPEEDVISLAKALTLSLVQEPSQPRTGNEISMRSRSCLEVLLK